MLAGKGKKGSKNSAEPANRQYEGDRLAMLTVWTMVWLVMQEGERVQAGWGVEVFQVMK